jgi:hypothetical protein
MADNLTQPLLIVNTQAQVAGQITPAMAQSDTASYAANQTLNQTLVLRAGQSYSPNIGFSNLILTTTGPVQLVAALGANPTFINQTVNQQTTIDTAADSFTVTNNGTTSVTVKMTIVVTASTVTPPVGVVTSLNSMIGNINVVAGPGISVTSGSQVITVSNTGVYEVNGQTGNISISASNLPGLSTVAISGRYSDLIGAPAQYVLPVATASILGGVKVGSGLAVTQDGTLSVTGAGQNLVTSVNTLQGAVTIQATDNGASGSQSLIVNSGATTGDIVLNRLAVAGSGLGISTANGVTTITSTGLQGAVLTVDGQHPDVNGNVVVQAVDNVGSGISLIKSNGATTGSLTFNRLIAGSNVTITPDVNGNLSIAGTVTPYTLPAATTSILGGVKQGTGVVIAPDGTISVASSYILPVATASVLGGVKIGANVNVAGDGTISVAAPYVLPMASATSLGGIKVGANLNLDQDGTLWANPAYPVVPATATILGGVKIGANVNVLPDGTISVAGPYSLPVASATVLGGIKVGANLNLAGDGTLSATPLAIATTTTLGGVIVGSNLTVDSSGRISATPYTLPVATPTVLGGVKQGSGVTIAGDGTLSVASYSLPVATTTVLGGVKQGANITIAGDGTISANTNTRTQQVVVATANGQSVFTFPDAIPTGQADAYLVGTYLLYGYDYTSSGTTVTLDPTVASKVVTGDQLIVNSSTATPIADAVQASVLAGSGGAGMVGFGSTTVAQELNSVSTQSVISLSAFSPKGDGTDDSLAFNAFIAALNARSTSGGLVYGYIPQAASGTWGINGQLLINVSNLVLFIGGPIQQLSTSRVHTLLFAYDTNQQPAQALTNVVVYAPPGTKVDGNGANMPFAYTPGDGSDDTSAIRFNYIDNLYFRGLFANNGAIDSMSLRQCRNWVGEHIEAANASAYAVTRSGNGFSATTDWNPSGWSETDPTTWGYGVLRNFKVHDNSAGYGATAFNCTGVWFEHGKSMNNLGCYSYEKQAGATATKRRFGGFADCYGTGGSEGFYIDDNGVSVMPSCTIENIAARANDPNNLYGNGITLSACTDFYLAPRLNNIANAGIALFNGVTAVMEGIVEPIVTTAGTYGILDRGTSWLRIGDKTEITGAGTYGIYGHNSGANYNQGGNSTLIIDNPRINSSNGSAIYVDYKGYVYVNGARGIGNCATSASGTGVAVQFDQITTLARVRDLDMRQPSGTQGYLVSATAAVAVLDEQGSLGDAAVVPIASTAAASIPLGGRVYGTGTVESVRVQNTAGVTNARARLSFAVTPSSSFIGAYIDALRVDTNNQHTLIFGVFNGTTPIDMANVSGTGLFVGNGSTIAKNTLDVGGSVGTGIELVITGGTVNTTTVETTQVNPTNGSFSLALPNPAACTRHKHNFVFVGTSANSVTINLGGGTYSDGTTSKILSARGLSAFSVQADAINGVWTILSSNSSPILNQISIANNSATPDLTSHEAVTNVAIFNNTVATTVTNLTSGVLYQTLVLAFGNTNTTVANSPGFIQLRGNKPFTPTSVNSTLTLYYDGVWKEQARQGDLQSLGVVATSAVPVPLTGSTSLTTLATIPIPGNALGSNGWIDLDMVFSWANSANAKTMQAQYGGVTFTVQAVSTSGTTSGRFHATIQNRGVTNSQVGAAPANNIAGTNGSGPFTGSVDTTQNQNLVIQGQLGLGTETLQLERYSVTLNYA